MSYTLLRSTKSYRSLILEVTAIVLLSLTALHPLMRGQLPLTADGELHLYRLVSLDHALAGHTLADGSLWPRYVAGMVFGYGAPMFSYYAPLSLYPLEIFHLIGASFLQAWLLGMAFYVLLGAFGAYLLGRAWGGRICGLVSAVAYTYAPYMLYDLVARGTVAELASLALLPWVLWALWRVATYGRRLDFVMTAVCFALFIPMHNVITLHTTAIIAIFVLIHSLQSSEKWRTLLRLGAALGVGASLVAFFWLPALTETRYIKLDAITANLPFIDVTANLAPLSVVFAWPITADPTQMQPPTPITLGWPQLIIAAIGVVLVLVSPNQRHLRLLVLGTTGLIALLVFMNTPPSALLWRTIPLIRYSQYPWRLLGPASLLLALLVGLGAKLILEQIQHSQMRPASRMWVYNGLFTVILTLMVIYGLPWLYPINLDDASPQSIVDAQDFERETGLIGTSSFGEYLPVWNFEFPEANALTARFQASPDGIIPRLEPPENVTLTSATWGNTSADLWLTAAQETTLTFDWFYFPGWWAHLEGQALDIVPSERLGLITVTVPAGEHHLQIGLGMTERQTQAALLSLVGAAALLGLIASRKNPLFRVALIKDQPFADVVQKSPAYATFASTTIIVMLLGLGLFLGKTLWIDQTNSPLRHERFANGVEAGVQSVSHINFNREIELIGFDFPTSEAHRSGVALQVSLYWRLLGEKVEEDYSTVISLRDAQGNLVAQHIAWQPGGLTTGHWLPGYYLQERRVLDIPPATPPGQYTLDVSVYEPDSGRSVDVINAENNPVDVKASIINLTIDRPESPITRDDITSETAIEQDFDGLRLLGLNLLPTAAQVGEELAVQWVWEMTGETPSNTTAALIWLRDGEVIASTPELPPVTSFSLGAWRQGDIWRGHHRVYVPGGLDSGTYDIGVRVGEDYTTIGSMTVTAPERIFTLPTPTFALEERWQNDIELLGYDLDTASELTLTLYWRSGAAIHQNLRLFVHLIDAEGHILAQSDRIPADWTRPTTGWAVGEVVTDLHTFASDEGDHLRLGWYDPITNQRVPLMDNGQDYLVLPIQ